MPYTLTDNIEEATHWMPTEDIDWNWSHVTVDKLYKLHYDPIEDEYYIVNDEGISSLIFLCHKGYYFIKD